MVYYCLTRHILFFDVEITMLVKSRVQSETSSTAESTSISQLLPGSSSAKKLVLAKVVSISTSVGDENPPGRSGDLGGS